MFALYHQERMAALEKGIDLPPWPEDFFREGGGPLEMMKEIKEMQQRARCGDSSQRAPHGTLLTGLILVSSSLTLYLALHFGLSREESGADAALFALIPAGTGAAFLVYYFTVGRKAAAEMEAERKARFAGAERAKNPTA
jgi:heme/copper-type cytochrome/quinol oxidase subunit 3